MALSAGAQAAISGGVVKIGVLNDMSGPYADATGPGSVVAAQMAAEDYVKKTSSKLKIEVVSGDHQNKPDVGLTIARKWYDTDGVDAIFDVPTSSIALAVAKLTQDKNKVAVFAGAGSDAITGKSCTPNTVQWDYDTWMLSHGTASAMVKQGGTSWFFLTADYQFGHDLEKAAASVVEHSGGKVLGSVNIPLGSSDFSSYLLQAQASHAKVIGLANAGADAVNAIKQAHEFGITAGGTKMAALLMSLDEIHGLGLNVAQGLYGTVSFYWDMNDGTRAWTKRFVARDHGKYPTMHHAGVYAGVLHYLKAVDALQDDTDGVKIVDKMKEMPTDDPLFGKGVIRVDGRKTTPAYLVQVKKPSESKYPWDYYKIIQTIPADQAFRPLNEGGCYLVKGQKS
jgi:branched-chain amino acid transport system substrate-binding protein